MEQTNQEQSNDLFQAALWVKLALKKLEAGPHPGIERATNAVRAALAELGAAPQPAAHPTTPAPGAASEAGERERPELPDMQPRDFLASLTIYPFTYNVCDEPAYDAADVERVVNDLLAETVRLKANAEESFQYAAGLQEQLHEARQHTARLEEQNEALAVRYEDFKARCRRLHMELQQARQQAATATREVEAAGEYVDWLQHAHSQRERHLAREAYTRGFAGSAQGYNAEIGPDYESRPAWRGQREVDVEDILSHPEDWLPAQTPHTAAEAAAEPGEGRES